MCVRQEGERIRELRDKEQEVVSEKENEIDPTVT